MSAPPKWYTFFMDEIRSFSGKWAALSNFFPEADGKTAEHRFQAAKTNDPQERKHILSRPKPGQAKYAGKRCTLRDDWEAAKQSVMLQILRVKFQDPTLRTILDTTGNATLTEGNRWHDNYWGQCTCNAPRCATRTGKNTLGNILMTIRDENRRTDTM